MTLSQKQCETIQQDICSAVNLVMLNFADRFQDHERHLAVGIMGRALIASGSSMLAVALGIEHERGLELCDRYYREFGAVASEQSLCREKQD